jgi:hypothetical protein
MKKGLLAGSSLLAAAVIASGLWAARANVAQQPGDDMKISEAPASLGVTMEELTAKADVIVTGQCLETHSQWVGRSLVTLATIQIGEAVKGTPGATVTVALPGGRDVNRKFPVAMTYAGAPSILPQEEVFLFLNAADAATAPTADSYSVTGFAAGKFSIVENDQGTKLVATDASKVALPRETGMSRGGRRATPLIDFKAKVKEYLNK